MKVLIVDDNQKFIANAMKSACVQCIVVGMGDYIFMPINVKYLADAIECYIHNDNKKQTTLTISTPVEHAKWK